MKIPTPYLAVLAALAVAGPVRAGAEESARIPDAASLEDHDGCAGGEETPEPAAEVLEGDASDDEGDDGSGEAEHTEGEDGGDGENGGDGDGEGHDEGFLAPYYDAAHEGGAASGGDGCFDSCSGDLFLDLARLLFSIETSHYAIPCRHGMVRHRLGEGGSPASLSLEGGMTTAGGGKGVLASARFWTPSPFFMGAHFEGLRPDGASDFHLAYPEAGLEVLYNLPVTLSGSGHLLVGCEEDRDPLFGGGLGVSASVFLSEIIEIGGQYRISWLEELPLHSASARCYWNVAHVSAWGGYLVLRNSDGDVLAGPMAGLRLRI